MKTQKSLIFIEQPEEMKNLDMDMIRGGVKATATGCDRCNKGHAENKESTNE